MANPIGLLFGIFLCSLVITGLLRRYAITHSLLDIPSYRSSHAIPTPRGGGMAIVLSFLFSIILLAEVTEPASFWALFVSASLIGLIGFIDDHGHIPARYRLIAHFVSAGWAVTWLGGMPAITLFGSEVDLGTIGNILAVIYLVWLLNLYNFMDGIDGIAGIEAVTVCFGASLLYALSNTDTADTIFPLLLLAAVGGFLIWNFPKSRIFMGDVGSGFIGIVLGVFTIQAGWVNPALIWCWLILLGTFIVDATITLLRRIKRGDKVYEAHRSHAYQYASRKYGAHYPVSLTYGGINLFWLLPMASLVALGWLDGLVGLFIAYAPLIWLAFRYKAGAKELQDMKG